MVSSDVQIGRIGEATLTASKYAFVIACSALTPFLRSALLEHGGVRKERDG